MEAVANLDMEVSREPFTSAVNTVFSRQATEDIYLQVILILLMAMFPETTGVMITG